MNTKDAPTLDNLLQPSSNPRHFHFDWTAGEDGATFSAKLEPERDAEEEPSLRC